jgi:hypothetical protein
MKQSAKDKILEGVNELDSVSASEDLEVQEVIKKIKNAIKEEEKSEK